VFTQPQITWKIKGGKGLLKTNAADDGQTRTKYQVAKFGRKSQGFW